VKAVRWEEGIPLALDEQDWEMYELPAVGDRYWHGPTAYRVTEVEEEEPPRVHLVHDLAREQQLLGALPDGYRIDAGRSSDEPQWHAVVLTPDGQPLGGSAWARADDCDEAIAGAVAGALETLRGRGPQ
jgi:hypothetical protein